MPHVRLRRPQAQVAQHLVVAPGVEHQDLALEHPELRQLLDVGVMADEQQRPRPLRVAVPGRDQVAQRGGASGALQRQQQVELRVGGDRHGRRNLRVHPVEAFEKGLHRLLVAAPLAGYDPRRQHVVRRHQRAQVAHVLRARLAQHPLVGAILRRHVLSVELRPVGRAVAHQVDHVVAPEHLLELLVGLEPQGVVDRKVPRLGRHGHLAHVGRDLPHRPPPLIPLRPQGGGAQGDAGCKRQGEAERQGHRGTFEGLRGTRQPRPPGRKNRRSGTVVQMSAQPGDFVRDDPMTGTRYHERVGARPHRA
ncbi:hypothetical protein JAN5088_03229 [Jannaschia rubra]|uniref:Uncharacterized protein n=1 Tax=Jannaschia rubra TaxID=282197 RepID=A0A0M6XVW2_9RHOB|nr:hypothetical protein JAN5088_03229 [Jannaschia rubra]